MTIAGHKPSGNNEWETPPEVFDHWNKLFHFTMDVCALPENTKCPIFWSPKDDALTQPWCRRNWMNPPYGRGVIDRFAKKAYEEARLGKLVVGLLPVSTDTRWWNNYVKPADHIFFFSHRINFLRNGKAVKGVSFAPCIVIWGLHP